MENLVERTEPISRASHPTKLGRRTQVVLGISPSTFKQTSYGGIGENATALCLFITQNIMLTKKGFGLYL